MSSGDASSLSYGTAVKGQVLTLVYITVIMQQIRVFMSV